MSGQPLNSCKKAIKHVINHLEPDDKVSLVVYDDHVDTIFTRQCLADYDNLVHVIDEITDRGFTNISGALSKAAEILNEGGTPSDPQGEPPQYQKIIFLFSDGEANKGITNIDDLGKLMTKWVEVDGIHLSSFGIGTQYNEKWMRSIARGGEGNYFFIDNVESIPGLVEKGLSGFTTIIGTHVNFKVRGINDHLLTSLQNDKSTETISNGKTLPYIRSLGLYQFMTTVEVNAVSRGVQYFQPVLEATLTFTPAQGLEDLSPKKIGLEMGFSEEVQLDHMEKNGDVVCYQTIGKCAEINHQVDRAMKGRRPSDAICLKKDIIAQYEAVKDLDQFGVIGAMLVREKKILDLLEKEGVTKKSTKTQEYTCNYGYGCTTSVNKSAWESAKKNCVEEDCDMGYELFEST
jgi:uncharacterized protein YegL